MAKIVIDARKINSSTGKYVNKLLEYLQQMDSSNKFLVLLHPKDIETWRPTNKNFSSIACPYQDFSFAEQLGLLKQISSLRPDLVHFTMVQQPILYRGKVVTTINDLTTVRFRNQTKNWLVFTVKQQVYKWVNKVVARKSVALMTFTEFVKNDIAKFAHINSRKITVTYLGADKITNTAEPVEGLEDSEYIMYVGRPLPHKNLERLISAFMVIKKDRPNLKLVLAGKKDAAYKQIERGVLAREFPDIIFTGFVSEGQLRWLYEHTAAYVFPSLSEGFGLPALEAMTAGAPVVSSNATCLPEICGDAAEYFDPLDIQAMADAIKKVLSSKQRQESLREKGYNQVRKYSWKRTAEQTLGVYREILEDKV